MEEVFIGNWDKQMKKGLLIFLVMSCIKKKNCYGYEIIQKIREKTGIVMADGTLYPILKKLKKNQFVLSKWVVNEDDAPRKYYYLTGAGNTTLAEMTNYWSGLNEKVGSLLIE